MKNENTNEFDFSQTVLKRLSNDFHIEQQVWGTHFSGKKYRIDAVIRPKDISQWANKNIAFGIEFKRPDAHLDIRDVSVMIRQAYDYLYTDFDKYGKIPILVCPLRVQDSYCDAGQMQFVKRLLGRFGIGEIVNTKHYRGLAIVFHDSHYIWDEKYGVTYGKTWKLDFSDHGKSSKKSTTC